MKGYFIVEVHVLNNTKMYQNFALKRHFPQIVIEINHYVILFLVQKKHTILPFGFLDESSQFHKMNDICQFCVALENKMKLWICKKTQIKLLL